MTRHLPSLGSSPVKWDRSGHEEQMDQCHQERAQCLAHGKHSTNATRSGITNSVAWQRVAEDPCPGSGGMGKGEEGQAGLIPESRGPGLMESRVCGARVEEGWTG